MIENPTVEDCKAMLRESYTTEGVERLLDCRVSGLAAQKLSDLLETVEGRRDVYCWAVGLAEGVMG